MIPVSDWGSCVKDGVATLACIPVVIQNIVNFLVMFAGAIAIFFIIFSGYKFVMSEGDAEKIASARKTLIYALVGLLVVALSFLFLNVLSQFTGVERIAPK